MFPDDYANGMYAVGTEVFSITDNKRKELLGKKEGFRKISIRTYYPADKNNAVGKKFAEIFSENKLSAVKQTFHIKNIDEKMLTAEYYENIPHADEKFPLVVFNHGYGTYMEANTYLCIGLASHGYIVMSVGHAYEAAENDYEDGSYDLFDKQINKIMYTNLFKAMIAQRKILKSNLSPQAAYDKFKEFQDTYAPYIKNRIREWNCDSVCALNEIRKRYEKWIDFSCGAGASGHSFGGATAYNLCQYNEEFSCGINIDGGLFGDYDNKIMKRPFCQICCKENINLETKPLLNTNAPVHYALFSNMKHLGFTDAKFYVNNKSVSGKMDSLLMYKHLKDIHILFFDKYLKKKSGIELPVGVKDEIEYK